MPTYDTTTILGGDGQIISDWTLGDDRIFVGDAQLCTNPPPPGDQSLTNVYFTLKAKPNTFDSQSILQIMILDQATPNGQITASSLPGAALSEIELHIFSANYQYYVQAGTVYYWDIRGFTDGGVTFTIASGTVIFLQNVTQTDVAGTPANLPNMGNPVFKGFTNGPVAGGGPYNQGDWYVNKYGNPGDPFGWYCVIGGSPGTWVGIGVLGDISGTPQPPLLPPESIPEPPPRFLGYISAPPTSGGPYYVGDWYRNIFPRPDYPSGWVCVIAGYPGTWDSDGIVGETP